MDNPIQVYRPAPEFLLRNRRSAWQAFGGLIVGNVLFLLFEARFDVRQVWLDFVDYLVLHMQGVNYWIDGAREQNLLLTRFDLLFLLPLCLLLGTITFMAVEAPVRHWVSSTGITRVWLCWRWQMPWDQVSAINVVENPSGEQMKLILTSFDAQTDEVDGVEPLGSFIETIRPYLPLTAKWRTVRRSVDVHSPCFAFAFGFSMPLLCLLSSIAYRQCGLQVVAIAWATVSILIAGSLWWWRPVSRWGMAPRYGELVLAALFFVLGVLITFLSWAKPVLLPFVRWLIVMLGW